MKALKIMDLIVISLFVVGISMAIMQRFNSEIVAENNAVETISQLDSVINLSN